MENTNIGTFSAAESERLAREIVKVLIEKKARDVAMFDVREDSAITDFYVNVSANSSTQVLSLADEVVYKIELMGPKALRVEGRSGREWLLVDFGTVIVNVFVNSAREFYNLDRLLSDGARVDISDLVEEVDRKFNVGE